MYGKQRTTDASFHLEQPDHDHAHKDVSYEEMKKPVQTVGYGEVHDLKDTSRPYPEEGKSPVDDHEELVKESCQPIRESVSDIETDTDMICINGELAQAEHKIDDDKAYTDLHDDKKEVVTLGQHTGNDHYTRETADEVQPDDHKDLVEESWQPIRELVRDIKTDTDMICIKDELAQAEHEVNDDEVYTDLRDDKKEVATVDQYTGNDNYTGEAADEIHPNDCKQLTE